MQEVDERSSEDLRLAVVGAGSWGTTLAGLAARDPGTGTSAPTMLWAREPDVANSVNTHHVNQQFLAGHALPRTLRATTSLEEALRGVDAVVMAVPAQHFRSVFRLVAPMLPPEGPVLSVVKGIER